MQSDLDPVVVGSDFTTSSLSELSCGIPGGVQLELNTRICCAANVFGALRKSILVIICYLQPQNAWYTKLWCWVFCCMLWKLGL